MKTIPKILVTPGEPAGIGYDILLDLPKKNFEANIVSIANIEILKERASLLRKKVNFVKVDINDTNFPKITGNDILIHNLKNVNKVQIGKPNIKHVPLILKSLNLAVDACLKNIANAVVTGPVQKSIIMKHGTNFSGHTEYIASQTGGEPIMMLHTDNLKVALLTTHIPLLDVPKLITKERLRLYIKIICSELKRKFSIDDPRISVCGLNPHAGEDGYIGNEEKNIIAPLIEDMKKEGFNLRGPFSADTVFTKKDQDIILAMFHDQGLPVLKSMGFGDSVNITLGLPFTRISVDHGTAYELAGKNKADPSSFKKSMELALEFSQYERK